MFDDGGNGQVTTASITARRTEALGGDLRSDFKVGFGADSAQQPGRHSYEAVYQVPYLAHAPMEPMNTTALYQNGTLEVWAGTQDGLGSRAFCAKTAGLPLEKVTFHLLAMGGGFGRRLPDQYNYLTYAVQTAMAIPGTPVKLIFTREQDMQHDFYRPNVMSRFRASFDEKNAPMAWSNDYTTDEGPQHGSPYRLRYPQPGISYGEGPNPYSDGSRGAASKRPGMVSSSSRSSTNSHISRKQIPSPIAFRF